MNWVSKRNRERRREKERERERRRKVHVDSLMCTSQNRPTIGQCVTSTANHWLCITAEQLSGTFLCTHTQFDTKCPFVVEKLCTHNQQAVAAV